jgi:PPOX class probable F420-dependent enzyme
MTKMSNKEVRKFLMKDTFTGKLGTIKKDGSTLVVPIWYILDERNIINEIRNIYFTTYSGSTKAKNIQRDPRTSICVDHQTFPYTFVSIFGKAVILPYEQEEILTWATRIAGRYVGKENAKTYGVRNSGKGEVLVQIKPTTIIAEKNIANWD